MYNEVVVSALHKYLISLFKVFIIFVNDKVILIQIVLLYDLLSDGIMGIYERLSKAMMMFVISAVIYIFLR